MLIKYQGPYMNTAQPQEGGPARFWYGGLLGLTPWILTSGLGAQEESEEFHVLGLWSVFGQVWGLRGFGISGFGSGIVGLRPLAC